MNGRALLLALTSALTCACAGSGVRPEVAPDGALRDVLSGEVQLYALLDASPAIIAVSDPAGIDALLRARPTLSSASADGRVICIVDVSSEDELARIAVADRLIEPALEEGGPLLLDAEGRIARELTGTVPRPALVRLGAGGEILERAPLAGAAASME